jgi:hypothetical protein
MRTLVALACLLGAASSAEALPCEMDPGMKGRSCDDPEWQAATKAYQACASQQKTAFAPGYTCLPIPFQKKQSPAECPPSDKCWPAAGYALGTAPIEEYNAARASYDQCVATVPPGCLKAGFPARQAERAKPGTPLTAQQPAPVQPAKGSDSGKPGYGKFGQAMVNATSGGASSPQRAAPAKTAPAAKPAAPLRQQPQAPPQRQAPPQPQPNFTPKLNQEAAPAFGPLQSMDTSDTQSWLEKQREKKRKALEQAPSKPKKRDSDDGSDQ